MSGFIDTFRPSVHSALRMASTLVAKSARGTAIRRLVQIAATVAVLAYLLFSIDAGAVVKSVRAIPTGALLGSLGLLYFAVGIGLFRWMVLLRAYGAQRMPSYLEAVRVFCGALFYNLLPGAVGGDLYRAYVTRHCFDEGGLARSGSVVFVDRVLGFSALLMLVGAASLFGTTEGALQIFGVAGVPVELLSDGGAGQGVFVDLEPIANPVEEVIVLRRTRGGIGR